jgi:hypothetical protein
MRKKLYKTEYVIQHVEKQSQTANDLENVAAVGSSLGIGVAGQLSTPFTKFTQFVSLDLPYEEKLCEQFVD